MSRGSINKVIVLGRLDLDPEIRYMPSGTTVANLSIATNDYYNNKNTGDTKELTEWHRVKVFGKTAEIVQKYVKKGDLIYIEGKLVTRKWQNPQGIDYYVTEVHAKKVELLNNNPSTSSIYDYIPAEIEVNQSKKLEIRETAEEYDTIPF